MNNKFPISELLLGTWYLDKVEIIGLNKNDSSVIVSQENRKDKIVFNKNTVETFPDTTEFLYYKPRGFAFYYKIEIDTLTNWTKIILVSKRKKLPIHSYVVVDCSLSHLIYESYESGFGLEKKQSRTRYHFVRNQDFYNPLIGQWRIDKTTYPGDKIEKDSIYTLQPIKDSIQELREMNEFGIKSEIDFTSDEDFGYTSTNKVVGIYILGNYMIDFSNKKLFFVSKKIVVYSFKINLDGTITLLYDSELTSHYAQ